LDDVLLRHIFDDVLLDVKSSVYFSGIMSVS